MGEEPEERRQKTTRVPPQHVYLEAAMYIRQTGTSFRKAAEKYNINYVTLRRFCGKLSNETNGNHSSSGETIVGDTGKKMFSNNFP